MKKFNNKYPKQVTMPLYKLLLLIFVTVLLTSVVTFASYKFGLNFGNDQQKSLNKIEEAYKQIDGDYYKDVDDQKLTEGAINGMIKSLDDPYSEYISSKDTTSYNEEISGDFVGIGAEMEVHDKYVRITSPMKDSPAEKAGIQPLDVITKVDNESIKDKSLKEIVNKVRGKKGTTVKLTIKRDNREPFDVKIKRDKIHLTSVNYSKKEDTAVISISKFQGKTTDELEDALKKAKKDQVNHVVLDLRNNPGGLLDEVVSSVNLFVDKNKPVIYLETKGDKPQAVETEHKKMPGLDKMNFSVLVNKGSASASEIFAGALQDYKIADVLGTTTFGKGIGQVHKEFKDSSILKYTNMRWLTPNKSYIHKKGIKPNKEIKAPEYEEIEIINPHKTYQLNDKSKEIKSIKIGLKALGYNINNKNESFDQNLETAVKSFQTDNKLQSNGIFTDKTTKKFIDLLRKKIQKEDLQLDHAIKYVHQ
ncbi:S41 family peptidase [Mammaliicoccus stepanovicii]|uniref:Probable CtpA-like serine protease n=1 Tax=Mammaliicoccus stepanovicii TaxID=643214 RepID=A0A239ZAC3_9STAP|nr:S41 family peptidase [Mammaliicoccus stepanovicii]PNZ73870.1 serine protease [Mammaliicoccus stepanovicii]GGI42178.1 serine protease [Mammaliicoccus stepanovicii]SNV68129.1 carboxy-terminal processing proteinase ctpA [Mammaliicoccus stepanovicii]